MGSSCEGDALILCRLLGFAVNSFDRPPQLGGVGPVVYALNEFSSLSSFVIRCHYSDLIILHKLCPSTSATLPQLGMQTVVLTVLVYICNQERPLYMYVMNRDPKY